MSFISSSLRAPEFNLPVLETVGHKFSLGHVVEPVQLPARVLASVEGREAMHATLEFCRQREDARLLEGPGPR